MQGKQNSLVPVAKLIADLPGLGLAIGPSQHSFTVADQVNQLVRASEADPDLGFMARTIALCSLPRTNPGNRLQYKRVNGPFTLIMTATGNYKLPFGNLPRLILAWVSTEAVRTQSPVLSLGKSLSDFMRALGVYDSSGRTQTRLRNQMKRLFGCTVTMIYEDENVDATVNAVIADSTVFWWNKPDQRTLWDSKIELGEKFFNEIIQHPVPLNMNTLTALRRSSLGLDLYLWLVYRTFPLRAPLRLTWKQVYRQFGAHPDKASDNEPSKTSAVQGSARVEEDQDGLAGVNLHHGSGRPDPASFDPGHRAGRTSPTHKLIPRFPALSGPSAASGWTLVPAESRSWGFLRCPEVARRRVNRFHRSRVIQGSFPRAFGTLPPLDSSSIRDTSPLDSSSIRDTLSK